ncbi:MAG: hypothetical protein QM796_04675 [Chthoniobacteraceae bacterium]
MMASCLATLPVFSHAANSTVTWICSTAAQPWQEMSAPVLTAADPEVPPQLQVVPQRTDQTMDGFGGCFNEAGWEALGKASAADRARCSPLCSAMRAVPSPWGESPLARAILPSMPIPWTTRRATWR